MYTQGSGRKLSEWQGYGASPDTYRNGLQRSQSVVGDAMWSFGSLLQSYPQDQLSPSRHKHLPMKSSQSHPVHHQDQYSSACHEEMSRKPSQSVTIKQEYFTPRQENMRGHHGTPITISSGGSWQRDEFPLSRPPQKRAGSPSVMYDVPTKRQQTYISPGMMHPSRQIPGSARQLLFEDSQQGYDTRYVNEQQAYQQVLQPRTSYSPYEQLQPSRSYSDRPTLRQFGDPQQYISPHYDPTRTPQPSHRLSPENQLRGRSPPRAPFPQSASQPILRSPSKQWSISQPQQQVMAYEQGMERLRAQSQDSSHVDPDDVVEQKLFKRTMTTAPENYWQENENDARNFIEQVSPESFVIRKPQPQLGSPCWENAKATRVDAPEKGRVFVQGHYIEKAGKRKVPEDQVDGGNMDLLFTPPQQRAKTPSVSSQRPSIQRGRSKSVAPSTRTQENPQPQRERTLYQPPSVEEVADDDTPDSTPLNEILRKQQRQGQMSRNNFDEGSYRAASVLPQDSIFGHDRPKAKPPIPRFASSRGFAKQPEVVSLLSTPDTSAGSPPRPTIRSVPMKDRIAPAEKLPAKKSSATPKSTNLLKKSTPKSPKKQRLKANEEAAPDPAIVRQKRAADLIITKEIKGQDEALDLALFGEVVGQSEEEKQKKEDEMRAESQRKRLAKEAELQAREEAEALAEMERVRVQAEKEEQERLEKEREEDRNKARREAEIKRREALEEHERDELRKRAAEKIEAERKKAEKEGAERERLKQEAKEKAEKIQAEAEQLAKLKVKQEEAKKQAASLSAARVPIPEDGEKADAESGGLTDKDGEAVMEEDSLFLPENPREPTQTDNRSRAKSVGPSSAAEVFAQSGPKAGISAYRAEKDAAELERAKLAKESRLNERWKRQEAARAMQRAPPPPRPKPTKAPKKDRPPPKSKAKSVISPPSSEAGSASVSVASQPILSSFNNISSANSSFSSTKSAPVALPPKPQPKFKSQVKLISQLELEKLEREQHEKRVRENALKKKTITEEQKAQRRKKEAEKACAKKKQQLIDEANENGVELSEEDLEAQLDTFMIKREIECQRRAKNRARQESILDFAPDNLTLESLIRPQNQSSSETRGSNVDDEELTLEEQLQRANEIAMKDSLKALAQQRGGSFARAAAKKTVADFQSDSESEEDPDDELPPKVLKNGGPDNGNQESVSDDSEMDDDEGNAVEGLYQEEHDAPDMSTAIKRHNTSKRLRPEMTSSDRDLIDNPNKSDERLVMLYIVKKELTFNGKAGKEVILDQFLSRKEANDFAAAKVQEFRKRPTKSISEGLDDDELYYATVIYDRGDRNQAYVYVSATPVSSGKLADFDPAQVDNRFLEKTYFVIQYISQRKVDEETGEVRMEHNDPEILSHFSQLEMANHEACTKLIELLKPKMPRIEYIEQHQVVSKMLRDLREGVDRDKGVFNVDIGPDEEQLQWVSFSRVRMEIKLFEMKGPRN